MLNGPQFCKHLVIPKPDNSKPLRLQPACSLTVILRSFLMLPTVQFDDKPFLKADEIYDVRPKWDLPTELESYKAPSSQLLP